MINLLKVTEDDLEVVRREGFTIRSYTKEELDKIHDYTRKPHTTKK